MSKRVPLVLSAILMSLILSVAAYASGSLEEKETENNTEQTEAQENSDEENEDEKYFKKPGFGIARIQENGNSKMMVKCEDGEYSHSIDGGETWIEGLPEGAEIFEEPFEFEGGVPFRQTNPFSLVEGTFETDDGERVMIKSDEDGNYSYSEDSGETWTEGLPEGFQNFGRAGHFGMPHGFGISGFADGEEGGIFGGKIMVEEEDGVLRFSTDGGETWNEFNPANGEFPKFNFDNNSQPLNELNTLLGENVSF